MSKFTIDEIKAIYGSNPSRGASGVSTISNCDDAVSFVKNEALTTTEDVFIGIGIAAFYHKTKIDAISIGGKKFIDVVDEKSSTSAERDTAAQLINVSDGVSLLAAKSYFSSAPTWSIELCMCYQVKPLNRDNVKNYFKSCGVTISSTTFLLKAIKVMSAGMPRLVEIDDVRNSAINNKFVKNHTSYASSGSLVRRCVEELGKNAVHVFAAEDIKDAVAASDAPYDITLAEKVTQRSMYVAYIYFDVNKSLPENWYQGTAAYETCPPNIKRVLRAFFKRLGALTAATDDIDSSNDVDELVSKLAVVFKV